MLRNQFIQVTVAALVVVGVLGACRNLIVDSTAEINEAFWLKYRQTKSLPEEGLQIRFQELLEDSRCPEDVVCVWEGVARIELELKHSARGSAAVVLPIFGYVISDDSLAHMSADTLGYRLTLMQLDPYPNTSIDRPTLLYKALVRVEKSTH